VGPGHSGVGVRVGTRVLMLPHRQGRHGWLQVDGEEPVFGESPGTNVMANTQGNVYVGMEIWRVGVQGVGWGVGWDMGHGRGHSTHRTGYMMGHNGVWWRENIGDCMG